MAEKGSDSGIVPTLTADAYFNSYKKRFGGFGQEFYAKKYCVNHEDTIGREFAEMAWGQMVVTDYPDPIQRYFVEYYQPAEAVEPLYYYCHQLARDLQFVDFIKITDVFAATEQSAMYGAAQQRLGLAQDRVAQYLRVINDMVKGLFQIIRELRILDERLSYYDRSTEKGPMGQQAEITLKGLWIDLVEGGAKNPASVLGLSQQLGFAVLPELFFSQHRKPLVKVQADDPEAEAKRSDDIKEKSMELAQRITDLAFNNKAKEVLARKLTQFYVWKDSTERELRWRRTFMIKYFRQYYATIKLYISWARPYLKQLRRLQLDVSKIDEATLVSAFEGSMIELEVLMRKPVSNKNPFYAVVLLTVEHTTQPKLSFAVEGGFHRGPLHTGRTFLTWRSYAWTDEDIKNYRRYRETQDFELLSSVDSTLAAALGSVEGEIKAYLEELGEEFAKKKAPEKEKKETLDLLEPLRYVVEGFWEPIKPLYTGPDDWLRDVFGAKPKSGDSKGDYNDAVKGVKGGCWNLYKLFKNAHGLLTW